MLSFQLNRNYIAKNLCENRYRPILNCNGNCVLMKKLKQEERKEQNEPGSVKLEIGSVVLSSKSFFATEIAPVIVPSISCQAAGDPGKPVDRAFTIFHPPSAATLPDYAVLS